tara:strand:- start:1209 stop:2087 length:879 start_codon:yes stop_codon:yes gene_type:complete
MTFFRKRSANPVHQATRANLLRSARFEVIPLKNLEAQLEYLPEGASVSVTASPAKTLEDTWTLSQTLADQGFTPVPHLAARMVTSEKQLRQLVSQLADIGVSEVFIVGGDAPDPFGPFFDSIQVLDSILELDHGLSHIGVTAYPDGHSFISEGALSAALHAKQEMLASAGVSSHASTQMCFDPGAISAWLQREREMGLTIPIHLGIPGAVDRAKLLSIGARLGVGASLRFLRKNRSTVTRLFSPGGYDPNKLLAPLSSVLEPLGISGLHIFTFNQIEKTEAWRRSTLDIGNK